MRFIVASENVVIHSAVVEAATSEDAVENYLAGEFVEDLGNEVPADETFIISVEEDDQP